jgi:anti-sigma regulatory factor (Ser/Thr protein kinase)
LREGGKNLRFDLHGGLDEHKIREVRDSLKSWFTLAEMDKGLSGILVILIEEIFTNIMDHSNATWIELGLAWFNDGTVITINDNGQEFDPTAKLHDKDFSHSLDEHADRHLGLIMVRKMCQRFVYFRTPDGINQIVMEVPAKDTK